MRRGLRKSFYSVLMFYDVRKSKSVLFGKRKIEVKINFKIRKVKAFKNVGL